MKRTDRHFRFMMRQLTRHTLLYTEMVTTGAILYGDKERFLAFDPAERPLALQLGGDDPEALASCALVAEQMGYDEVNLNVGCPSDRVQQGRFGACLMRHPQIVAAAVDKMRSTVDIPVTVKHRIGVDELNRYEDLENFVSIVNNAGCDRFTVHARLAWLDGLSPQQNREIPPLRYDDVYRLKQAFPNIFIELNGGVKTLEQVARHLEQIDAVMVGRAAWDTPFLFANVDQMVCGVDDPIPSRDDVVRQLIPTVAQWRQRGIKLTRLIRPMLNLYARQRGSRIWKRILTEKSSDREAGVEVIEEALEAVVAKQANNV